MQARTWSIRLVKMFAALLTVAVFCVVFRVRQDTPSVAVADKELAFLVLLPCLTFFMLLWFCLERNRTLQWTLPDLLAGGLLLYFILRCQACPQHALFVPVGLGCLYLNLRIAFSLDSRLVSWLALVVLLTGIAEAFTGLAQLYGFARSNHSLFRMTGSFFNPGPYSNYLAVVAGIAIYHVAAGRRMVPAGQKKRRLQRLLRVDGLVYFASWIFLFLALIVLPATRGRIAWLAVIAAGLLVVFRETAVKTYIQRFYRRRKALFALVSAATIAVGILSLVGLYHYKKDSAGGRWLIWKVSTGVIREHPVSGVGPGRFAGAYGDAQEAWFSSGRASEAEIQVAGAPDYAFNDFIQLATEIGMPGFLLLIGVLALSVKGLARRRDGLLYGLIALLVVTQASYPLSLVPFCISGIFFIAAAQAGGSVRKRCYAWVPGVLLVAALVWGCYAAYGAVARYRGLQDWKLLQTSFQLQDYRFVAREYGDLYPALCDEPRFLFEYGQALGKTECYFLSDWVLREGALLSSDPMFYNVRGNNYKARGNYAAAEQCYLRAYSRLPNRIYPLYLLAKLYFETGQDAKARDMARRVDSFEPKIPSVAVREMKGEIRKMQNAGTE